MARASGSTAAGSPAWSTTRATQQLRTRQQPGETVGPDAARPATSCPRHVRSQVLKKFPRASRAAHGDEVWRGR